jgi:hypothetical protein
MVNGSDTSDRPDRLERLYSILEGAEGLLRGLPPSGSGRTAGDVLAARVESVIARGWDSPVPDDSGHGAGTVGDAGVAADADVA